MWFSLRVCVCVSYHVADLHVAVTEDNGVGGVPHWKHDPEWHAHGGRDQSVEGVDLQRLWLDGGKWKQRNKRDEGREGKGETVGGIVNWGKKKKKNGRKFQRERKRGKR